MTDNLLTHQEFLAQQLQDADFRAAWDNGEAAHQFRRLRLLRKLTQAELAQRAGTRQPSIARLESGKSLHDLEFLRRVAAALDADVEIRLIPHASA